MVHKHSPEGTQKEFIRHLVKAGAYHDKEKKETVNQLTSETIKDFVAKQYEFVQVGLTDEFDQGLVLTDPVGNGAFQLCLKPPPSAPARTSCVGWSLPSKEERKVLSIARRSPD